MVDTEELARAAYAAYGRHTDYKNFQGGPMPAWKDLPFKIRGAWFVAACAVWEMLDPSGTPSPPAEVDRAQAWLEGSDPT